ncbi:Vgb family protein [Actinomadura macrotermitis]|uniref:Virginiamycin B lyase n=1 Tax=Actinomadura macrotermitis TaxID=2585200 RepID=A0A7K0BYI3_9ACTN|nr:hypothetical protein [Actinomadura macrotermitis]MQY06146.1 Virginiamycin B lyase [Actinomadura macrotermitis]
MRRRTRAGAVALTAVLGTTSFLAVTAGAAHAGTATEYSLPIADVAPTGLAGGPGGSVWFTETSGGIGQITASGKVKEYQVPRNSRNLKGVPAAMANGTDGSIWYTDTSTTAPRLGRVDPATGASTLFELPTSGPLSFPFSMVNSIAPGANGTMWFSGLDSGVLGKIDASGNVTLYAAGGSPSAVTLGKDGAVWYAEQTGGAGRLDPATGEVRRFPAPDAVAGSPISADIVTGADGRIWFTKPGINRITSIDPATGAMTDYTPSVADSRPTGLLAGPDGRIWFAESAASNIGVIDASGTITEYPLPATLSAPRALAFGPGGKIWYSAPGRGRIGSFDPASPPSGPYHAATPPLTTGTFPQAAPAYSARCTVGMICQTQIVTGGEMRIGDFVQKLPRGAIRVTGGINDLTDIENIPLVKPVVGAQLEAKELEVPGGLVGRLPLVGPILGKSPAAMWAVNRLTVTQSLAAPPTAYFNSSGGLGARLSLNLKLNNTLLGPSCVIGPVNAALEPDPVSGAFANDQVLGWTTAAVSIKAPVAVPAAKGCGPGGILNGVVDQLMGLPSGSAKNSLTLDGVLSLAGGTNPSNVKSMQAKPGTTLSPALQRLLAPAAKKKHALPKAPKKVKLRLTARH